MIFNELERIKNILSIIQIVVPILLLIMVSVQLFNMVTNPDEKKNLKKIFNMTIAAVVVFIIPIMINAVMGILGEDNKFSNCWNTASSNGLGNSTYIDPYNGKKNRTKPITSSNGYNVSIKTATRGGATLRELSSEYASTIGGSSYDCVILQEQTDTYASNYNGYSSGAKSIISTVRSRNSNVHTYIRALWVTRSASSSTRNNSYSWTEKIAKETNSTVIYDGKSFDTCSSSINLFGDDIHQNNNGAYLSALTIYKALSGEKSVSTTYYGGVDSNTAKALMNCAQ